MTFLPRKPMGYLAFSLILLAFLVFPLASFARLDCIDGGVEAGEGGAGGPEGDPLDSNDTGSDGGGNVDVHVRSVNLPGPFIWFDGRQDFKSVMLLQIYVIKGVPVISILPVPSIRYQAEDYHVR